MLLESHDIPNNCTLFLLLCTFIWAHSWGDRVNRISDLSILKMPLLTSLSNEQWTHLKNPKRIFLSLDLSGKYCERTGSDRWIDKEPYLKINNSPTFLDLLPYISCVLYKIALVEMQLIPLQRLTDYFIPWPCTIVHTQYWPQLEFS